LAWGLRALGGPPYWCFAHGEELTLARTSTELSWLTRRVFRGAVGVIANSGHTREVLIQDWSLLPSRVHVLSPGVDTRVFVPAPPDPDVRRRLGWGARRVVLTVGAMQARKGQDMMLRALPRLLTLFPDLLYVQVGEGWERPRLEQLVDELGLTDAVQFRGARDDQDLVRCYQQCDLFALPNRQVGWDFEGFGIVLLEAQASGKPVLAGASGGTSEAMQVPDTGVILDCTTPGSLAEGVARLLADRPRLAQMGARARAWAVERFDWSVMVAEAVRLFGDALNCSPPRIGRRTDAALAL
jgi:phosphatidylinositol alpha-1,6-mannosyltransferase